AGRAARPRASTCTGGPGGPGGPGRSARSPRGAAGNGGLGGGGSAGAGGSPGGASGAAGTAGTAGTAGAGGGAGAGGSTGNSSKLVLLYHFSTLAIASVPEQLSVLSAQLQAWGYEVEESDDPADINPTKLASVRGVGMINTCFEPFGKGSAGTSQSTALDAFVRAGGALFGTHCAAVTYQTASPPHPYNEVIGGRGGDGYFDGTSACRTLEAHPSTMLLPTTFDYVGNLDNADFLAEDTQVLVRCRWSGGAQKDVAVSWSRTPGQGRVFYTNFAKEAADLKDATLGQKHILAGLSWALGR
ncbi:MAG: hypothetical protein EOO73_36400, partial [Myxococcales bacterium]